MAVTVTVTCGGFRNKRASVAAGNRKAEGHFASLLVLTDLDQPETARRATRLAPPARAQPWWFDGNGWQYQRRLRRRAGVSGPTGQW